MINDVSVVIVTKNRVDFFRRAFNSVICQSYGVKEVVVVDDFSEHPFDANLLDFCTEKAKEKNISFNYSYNYKQMGGNFSRNLGAEQSTSKIIMFLDDDDFWEPNKVKNQVKYFDEGYEFIYTGKKFVNSTSLSKVVRVSRENNKEKNIWLGNYIGSTSGVALTKDLFTSVGKFDEDLMSLQDFDLWVRCLNNTKAKWDEQHNLIYTVHKSNNNQISSNVEKHLRSVEFLSKKYAKEISCLTIREQRHFQSRTYHLIARAYRRNKDIKFIKYYLKSLFLRPSLRTASLIFFY
ncbi:glycosyltransferase family 2 protein [Vibrio cyclitrophicus]|uniref:glycosyltransferase family 2 protein n=1 Tax=Vibrio splendidus TaxID=29497 RepID=UPI00352D668A